MCVWFSCRTWAQLPLTYLVDRAYVCVCVHVCVRVYLLLVFSLQMQPGLDVSSGLLKGLSLGDLSGVVGTDTDHVSAQEDQNVGTDLQTHMRSHNNDREGEKGGKSVIPSPHIHMSHHSNTMNSVWPGRGQWTKLITLCVIGFTAWRNIPQTSEGPLDVICSEMMMAALQDDILLTSCLEWKIRSPEGSIWCVKTVWHQFCVLLHKSKWTFVPAKCNETPSRRFSDIALKRMG